LFFLKILAGAQIQNQYHIDINNGLPSNHVYNILKDQHGYLWIATDKGVLRYNGYGFYNYNISNGLSTNDIWHLFEDNEGRIWLIGISDGIGYIYNNKYIACKNGGLETIYPGQLTEYNGVIVFANIFYDPNSPVFCSVYNDIVHPYIFHNTNRHIYIVKLIQNGIEIISTDGYTYFIRFNFTIARRRNRYDVEYYVKRDKVGVIYDNNFISYLPKENYFETLGIDGIYRKHTLNGGEQIITVSTNKKELQLFTVNDIYIYNNDLQLIKMIPVKDLVGNEKDKVIDILEDKFWGNAGATEANGLFINYPEATRFRKDTTIDFANYKYAGSINDSIGFWWNDYKNTLAKVINGTIHYSRYDSIQNIRQITRYDSVRSLLFARNEIYWLNNKDNKITPFWDHIKYMNYDSKGFGDKYMPHRQIFSDVIASSTLGENIYAAIPAAGRGVCHFFYHNDSVKITTISDGRYFAITYDSLNRFFWIYNRNKILIADTNDHKLTISKPLLDLFGIKEIEKILTDRYGDVFIKDYNALYLFNLKNHVFTRLFKNYTLTGTVIDLYHDKLMIAGNFGILFGKIKDTAIISDPVTYLNIKSLNYNYVEDMQVSADKALVKTNKGVYWVDIPAEDEYDIHKDKTPYQLILNYDNKVINIKAGDTVFIDQKDWRLQFDVINPVGNGTVKYTYKLQGIDTAFHELSNNELTLPELKADKYFAFSIIAGDNSWQSDNVNIHLYIIPYWWQTSVGRKLVWLSIIIFFITFVYVIVAITRKLITRNTEKKGMQLELELKSIYSQINPHFIFNTLGSALLLIQKKNMDGAYIHISKFSRLLRAYIKSARNKYITLEEEINNLRTYTDLQQTRFKDKFDVEIIVDADLNVKHVKIPTLLLQPIVENAINHGLFHKKEQGHLKIEFRMDELKNEIVCIIDDNGIGRKQAKLIKEQSAIKEESYGDQLIKDLIAIFNKYEKTNIQINYIDKESPLTGTIVELRIRNYQYE